MKAEKVLEVRQVQAIYLGMLKEFYGQAYYYYLNNDVASLIKTAEALLAITPVESSLEERLREIAEEYRGSKNLMLPEKEALKPVIARKVFNIVKEVVGPVMIELGLVMREHMVKEV